MESYIPKLWSSLKGYSSEQFIKDLISGLIVAIIALPLSIALALASGVGPEKGIYTAVVAGFVIAAFGGSKVQVSGPTAAFATIVAGIVATKGIEGLVVATILAGIILILMGLFKLGSLIKYIPYTIVTGFTAGIAITIVIGQLKNFLGLTYSGSSIHTLGKVSLCLHNIQTTNMVSLFVGVLALIILFTWPKFNAKIPSSLIALIVTILMVKFLNLDVKTIGSSYEITNALPQFHLPTLSFDSISDLLPDALTIAILASIESLLSCVVSDGMIGDKHNPNAELVGQGIGNIASALFGGIPATGAIARTAANVKSGGRTPISAMVHAIILLLILIVLMPYASLIPMPTIAAILFMVAVNMSGYRECVLMIKAAPKSDTLVFLLTLFLTVIFDLVVAIEIGIILASLLFINRMSNVVSVRKWEEKPQDDLNGLEIPKGTLVYEVDGPMFFAATEVFMKVTVDKNTKVIILRMRSVPAIDVSALKLLEEFVQHCQKENITVIMSHVCKQPYDAMKKAKLVDIIQEENFDDNIHEALEHAKEICELQAQSYQSKPIYS